MAVVSPRGCAVAVVLLVVLCALPTPAQTPRSTVTPVPSIDPDHDPVPFDGLDLGALGAPGVLAPPLTGTFEGYAFDDNATYNGGYLAVPPDPIGVAGPSHLVAVGNYLIEWRDRSGANLVRSSLQSFFGSATLTFDPKVIYDQHAQRFVVVALERDLSSNQSRILVAVSTNADPNNGWHTLTINSKLNFLNVSLGTATDHWADYPGLAVDDDAIYVTNNMFTFPNLVGSAIFGDSRLWIVRKGRGTGGFYDGGPAAWNVYDASPSGGAFPTEIFTLQPAHVFGPNPGSDSVFLVSAGWSNDFSLGNGSGAEFLSVTRIDNPVTGPSFSQQFVNVGNLENALSNMPDAPQASCVKVLPTEVNPPNQPVETNDRRALHCVWRNQELWVTAQLVPEFGMDAAQSTAHWWRLDTNVPAALLVMDQGDVGAEDLGPQTHTFFPSIAVNATGDMAIGFAASNEQIFPGAFYTGRRAADPPGTVDPTSVLAWGQDCYSRNFCSNRNRWGDYSGSSVDPLDDQTFWVFNQYAIERGTPTSCPSYDEVGRWSTRWGQFGFGMPDLVVSRLEVPCCTTWGDLLAPQLLVRIRNIGTVGTGAPVQVTLFVSPDPVIDTFDVPLPNGTVVLPPLAAGAEFTAAWPANVMLPAGTPPGPMWIGAWADIAMIVAESDETNNTLAQPTSVHVAPWECARAEVSSAAGTPVSVYSLPNGAGTPLTAAQWWDGVPGSTPVAVDATITARLSDEALQPVPNALLTLGSTLGGLRVCANRPAANAPSNAMGEAHFSGALFAGGHSDPRSGERAIVLDASGAPLTASTYGSVQLMGTDQSGNIYDVDRTSGVASMRCIVGPSGATDIDFDPTLQLAYVQAPDGNFSGLLADPFSCLTIGGPFPTPWAFNGVEWVRGMLYGTGIAVSCGASTLVSIDPFVPNFVAIGPTGLGPISGLAYDPLCDCLYGVTGCVSQMGPSQLVRIDRLTGLATIVGGTPTGLGGLEFGPDGRLYAGGITSDGANLYVVDRNTAALTLVGATGIAPGVTGLTLVSEDGLDMRFNSADITGDLVVDLVDVGFLASAYLSGVYTYAIDFVYDGLNNLADIGRFSGGLGATCPSSPKSVAEDAGTSDALRIVFASSGTADAVAVQSGGRVEATLVATGDVARRGVQGWEGIFVPSANLRVEGIELCARSLDVDPGESFVVGLVAPLRDDVDVVLARIHLQVLDEEPATLTLAASARSSVGGRGPALLVAGSEGTVLRTAMAPTLALNDRDAAAAPRSVDLRNVPNPFNPRTEIRFQLPRGGDVEVRIFDVGGRWVRTLAAEDQAAGSVALVWDGTDHRGVELGSGLFLYRLLLDGEELGAPRKMALLR